MINLFLPSIGQEEIDAVSEVLRSGWLGLGPKTKEFEDAFAKYIGVPYAVGVNSCTAALDLAVKLCNIQEGDEVLVPTLTFVSTAHAVVYNKGTPVFCDIDPDTLLISLDSIREKLTSRTKAIIIVHFGGRCVDIEAVRAIVGPDVKIIEDNAHAAGSSFNGKMAGSLGDIGCFSFQAVKNICCGDGGMLTLKDEEEHLRAKKLRWLGIDKGTWDRTTNFNKYLWEYNVEEIGLKCHMNDIMAAIGLVQLKRLNELNQKRREVVKTYYNQLSQIPEVVLPVDDDGASTSSWHLFPIKIKNRDDLLAYLMEQDIHVGVHYKPIHLYPCYQQQHTTLPVAEQVWLELLSLPLHPNLTHEDVLTVCNAIQQFLLET